MKYIFTVTTVGVRLVGKHHKKYTKIDARTVAWCDDWPLAEKIVTENRGFIHEAGHYPYAVIEKLREGLYPDIVLERWYFWLAGKYTPIEKPAKFANMVNWSWG